MAIGDQTDFVARLKSLLPNGWFSDSTPILDGVLSGIASALAFVYGLITYAAQQTRVLTATDGFLDLISFDFFGLNLLRKPQELDAPFRTRILAELFLERATRAGLIETLVLLTGRKPKIFEPALPSDTGGYNTNSLGYGVAGGYGSLVLQCQVFVIAFRPSGSGIPNVAGYGSPGVPVFSSVFGTEAFGLIGFGALPFTTSSCTAGAYNTPSESEYATLTEIVGSVTDSDIYAAIDSVMAAGTIAWTQLSN